MKYQGDELEWRVASWSGEFVGRGELLSGDMALAPGISSTSMAGDG